MRFKGKTVVVTGAASGIGRATAMRLAIEGADLVLSDIQPAGLSELTDQIVGAGGNRPKVVVGDISREDVAKEIVDTAIESLGRIDALVNCAGVHHIGDIDQTSLEDWNRVIGTNLTSMFLLIRSVIPYMVKQRSGAIVNLSSVSAFVGQEMGETSTFLYNVTKAGVRQLTTSLATRYAAQGIRVNCVCPGGVHTRMAISEEQERDPRIRDAILAAMSAGHPMRRVAEPSEIAAAICFLASDEASFVTGTAMPVDGGYLAQ